jgi:hypothetical protein
MADRPFQFEWPVDQDGYATERIRSRDADGFGEGEFEYVIPRGGPPRYYRPLDDAGLWLRFADTCRSPEGVLQFVGAYGTLRQQPDNIDHYQRVATRLWAIHERLEARDRRSAAEIFISNPLWPPRMREAILWFPDRPEAFELVLIPDMLEGALKHQAAEAITGNRQFRRCRNEGCADWFRLGPRAKAEGGHTYTARREFCSDRCRVAHARRQRREASGHA